MPTKKEILFVCVISFTVCSLRAMLLSRSVAILTRGSVRMLSQSASRVVDEQEDMQKLKTQLADKTEQCKQLEDDKKTLRIKLEAATSQYRELWAKTHSNS